jgi:hypothetical protein
MKFELQTRNRLFRRRGAVESLLPRKFGPKDFLVKGSSGVRLESETNGVLEFETGWHRKWSKLREEIVDAAAMTAMMSSAPEADTGRRQYPFSTADLRTGSASERKSGRWKRRKGMEGGNERILRSGEAFEVEIVDPTWNAGIQSSESFELNQYESFLRQHEFDAYREPVITSADAVLSKVGTGGASPADIANLRNFLMIIVDYIKRGQGGPASDAAGAFEDVRGMPSKQAFTLMSRTSFDSMFASLLSPVEQGIFRKVVTGRVILKEMGLTTKSPFFIKGYGTHPRKGPTVHQWLAGIPRGTDRLSVQDTSSMSSAQGRHDVETKAGEKDTNLVRFETRNRPTAVGGAFRKAAEWEGYARMLFLAAAVFRHRPNKKGQTGLDFDP